MLCMNARKMNVAIGQDLLGQQVIELGMDPHACVHTKLKVIVGERFLVTFTNALPAVAMESELTPEAERLSALMELRRIRKSKDKIHNRLEQSVIDHYKDTDEYDALRVKAIVGHYLLHVRLRKQVCPHAPLCPPGLCDCEVTRMRPSAHRDSRGSRRHLRAYGSHRLSPHAIRHPSRVIPRCLDRRQPSLLP